MTEKKTKMNPVWQFELRTFARKIHTYKDPEATFKAKFGRTDRPLLRAARELAKLYARRTTLTEARREADEANNVMKRWADELRYELKAAKKADPTRAKVLDPTCLALVRSAYSAAQVALPAVRKAARSTEVQYVRCCRRLDQLRVRIEETNERVRAELDRFAREQSEQSK